MFIHHRLIDMVQSVCMRFYVHIVLLRATLLGTTGSPIGRRQIDRLDRKRVWKTSIMSCRTGLVKRKNVHKNCGPKGLLEPNPFLLVPVRIDFCLID